MSEAWAFIATKQAYDTLAKMSSYIRENNEGVSETDALYLSALAAQYIQPVTDDDLMTKKIKEWGQALVNPDKFQELQDERERKRNAPIERAYRQHLNDIRLRDLKNHMGEDAPDRRVLPTDKAVQKGRDLLDIIQRRRKMRQTQRTVDQHNEQAAQHRQQQANQPFEVDPEGGVTPPNRGL